MTTKIVLLIALITALTIKSGFSQETDKGLYIKIHAGYSVLSPGGDPLLISPGFFYAPEGQLLTLNSSTKSGEGLNLGLGVQKDMGKLMVLSLDINYLAGQKFTSTGTYGAGYTLPYSWNATGTQSTWSIVPGISFKILPQPTHYFYTRLGLILAFGTKYNDDEPFPSITGGTNFHEIDRYNYGLSVGFEAAAGFQFKLAANLKGFVELNNSFVDVSPNEVINQNTVSDGSNSNVYNQRFIYIKSNSGNTTGSGTTNIYYSPSIVQHFNSTMLNIGVAFAVK